MSARIRETVAVVRSFNEPTIGEFLKELSEFIPYIVVVVYEELDKGVTRKLLESMRHEIKAQFWVVGAMSKDGLRGWSTFLNIGLSFVKGLVAGGIKLNYLFNVSNTTSFKKDHLMIMLGEFDDQKVGIVGTTFRGIDTLGKYVELGESYNTISRNTGMIIRLSVFNSCSLLAGFDPTYDGRNGMEDYAFTSTAIWWGWEHRLLDLRIRLICKHWNQVEKEEFMSQGMIDVKERLIDLGVMMQ